MGEAAETTTVLGHAIDRREDPGLLTGSTPFLADLPLPDGCLHAVFVRSTVAHGVVGGVDVSDAAAAEGVHAVLTARDLGLRPMQAFGREPALARPLLAGDRVRFAGEPLAVVLADTPAHAADAAELVVASIEPLAAVVDPVDAMRATEDDGPVLFPEHGSNVVLDLPPQAADDLFDSADRVIAARFRHRRVAPVTMEPNGLLALPGEDPVLTVWASTQSVFGVRREIAKLLDLDDGAVRVTAAAIGGGFGAKGGTYPEQLVVAALAHRLRRPVRWIESRTENLLGMTHGRGSVQDVEVGVMDDGRITAMRVRAVADAGAYSARGVFIPFVTQRMASGTYAIPRIEFRPTVVVTNTTPTGPYRGAGRPEAAAMCERVVELVASELGLDPVDVRRRNFIPRDAFPYKTATGADYDVGDYERALDEALRLSSYDELRAEQVAAREGGDSPLIGIGVSCYVEVSGNGSEYGSVTVEGDGSVTVVTGSVPHGQGHETVWAQIAASVLGVAPERVRVVHSDTAIVPRGTGTFGSRSLQLAGSAVQNAAVEVVERARQMVADALEASVDDVVVFDGGRGLGVAGTPASAMSWAEVAALAGTAEPLSAELDFEQGGTYPFGAHVAVVTIDRDTGDTRLRSIVAVDDCGRVINEKLAEGQVHGGLAQGIAQVLFEEVVYDADGNPLTSTLVDYAMPSAADLPSFTTAHTVTPTPRNPLGAKGIGESGTTGSIAAVWNAVIDALAPFGVRHLDPPFTPERIWRAMEGPNVTL